MGSGIPELKNRVKKPSYGLWRHKTELRRKVTSQQSFCNSVFFISFLILTVSELLNSEILFLLKIPSYVTRFFLKPFFILKISELPNSEILFLLKIPSYEPFNKLWNLIVSKLYVMIGVISKKFWFVTCWKMLKIAKIIAYFVNFGLF